MSPFLTTELPPSPLFYRPSPSKTTDCAVVPPSHPSRTLVLCFYSGNGLGGKYDSGIVNSVVTKFFSLLIHDDRQRVCQIHSPECEIFFSSTFCDVENIPNILDKDYAWNLGRDIQTAYINLVRYYRPGDKISLFGFSRGAYTARALAEMIHKVGLLPNSLVSELELFSAYSLYTRDVDDDWHKSFAKFKELGPMNVPIDFVGVWDTVSSVGDVFPTTLPFTKSNTSIRVFRHALALHEPRARLHPKFYEFNTQGGQGGTDVQEVWFAGSHCDIGGCTVSKDSPHSLGRIPLRWMVRECFRADTGIRFHAERLRDIGLDPASLYPIVKERARPLQPRPYHFHSIAPSVPMASEEEHDVRDALSPMHDQLTAFTPLWWILNFLPVWRRIPLGLRSEWNEPQKTMRINLPRGLIVPKDHSERFYIQPTVYTRIEAKRVRGEPRNLT